MLCVEFCCSHDRRIGCNGKGLKSLSTGDMTAGSRSRSDKIRPIHQFTNPTNNSDEEEDWEDWGGERRRYAGWGHCHWSHPVGDARRVTDENAHPHMDCTGRFVVIHNGIVENYQELKRPP